MATTKTFFDVMESFNELFETTLLQPNLLKVDNGDRYTCPGFPPVNVSVDETKKDLRFEFAIAGVDPSRTTLSFAGDFMELKIEKEEEMATKEKRKDLYKGIKNVYLQNKYFVPSDKYNTPEATAEFKNGILKIDIPAREHMQVKPVKIKLIT